MTLIVKTTVNLIKITKVNDKTKMKTENIKNKLL